MSKLIAAHTNLEREYPGYINFSREDDGTVTVYLRGNPEASKGVYICGYAADKGKPGRCTPGDDRCNNYCNMAPAKGPMQDGPSECTQVKCGETVKLTLSAADFGSLIASAKPNCPIDEASYEDLRASGGVAVPETVECDNCGANVQFGDCCNECDRPTDH